MDNRHWAVVFGAPETPDAPRCAYFPADIRGVIQDGMIPLEKCMDNGIRAMGKPKISAFSHLYKTNMIKNNREGGMYSGM